MNPFLRQVAEHYYVSGTVEDKCFIFPNRRSLMFFTKYLRDAVSDSSLLPYGGEKKPLRMPLMMPISDFFFRAHGLQTEDRVSLLLDLYGCYSELNPKAEPLDEFISWGEVILSDFSDVDKYMTDPKQVFTNVSDYKEMQDDYSYLTERQREAVESFISNFREGGHLRENARGEGVKANFLMIWDLLYPLYVRFNEKLSAENKAYDGMAYRKLVESLKSTPAVDFFGKSFPGVKTFVFIGLNALNESERFVLKKMQSAGMAEFCWDFSSEMLRNLRNRSSAYMKMNVEEFPQTWKLDPDGLQEPEINVLAVPSSVGQAKQLPQILSLSGVSGKLDCTSCAIVLPDEALLVPVLNSIPPEIDDINVTMGYPMQLSGIWSLMSSVSAMQLHMRRRGEEWYFYHRQVTSILTNPLVKRVLDEKGKDIVLSIFAGAKYFIPQSDFRGSQLLELIFRPVLTSPSEADKEQIASFMEYQKAILTRIVPDLAADGRVEAEFAKRYYECVNMLEGKGLEVKPATYIRLLSSIAAGESVPFSGEPLKGLQIMGPLETRALDFDNVIILSCNEGIFPKKNSSVSFIPPQLRIGFGLPTTEFKDAVLAYSFYRLIQRASKVWLVYDSRMEKTKSGEESRYIKQLQYHFRLPLKRYVAKSEIKVEADAGVVPKPADIKEILKKKKLSVTSLQNYLSCPAKFYYSKVVGLKADSKVSESLDGGMKGNVFHAVMQAIYLGEAAMDPSFPMDRDSVDMSVRTGKLVPLKYVSASYLSSWLKRKDRIRAKIQSLISSQLNTMEVRGRDLVTEEVLLQYVMKTLERDIEYLRDAHSDRFEIIGLEKFVTWNCDGYSFLGYIDRVDSPRDGVVRIVDYKTGKVEKDDVNVGDDNAEKIVEDLFKEDNPKRPKIALQLFLYDKYVKNEPWVKENRVYNTIYPAPALFTSNVADFERPVSKIFGEKAMEGVKRTLEEISDPSIPFRRTSLTDICDYCDFRNICGR